MTDKICDIMVEHLKLLAESAQECEDKDLGIITQSMISTAQFLCKQQSCEKD